MEAITAAIFGLAWWYYGPSSLLVSRLLFGCALIVLFAPLLLRFSVLDAAVGIFFQPASTAILGTCGGYVVLHPCPVSGRF